MRLTDEVVRRFWSKVAKGDGCWEWQGERHAKGYGVFYPRKRKKVRASRLAYVLTHGPIPDGMQVLHRCDNPPCCNPAHLFHGTNSDNVADALSKGRMARRLTADAVREIRSSPDTTEAHKALAARFGCSPKTVRDVMDRLTWRHVA
jgi:hypothetical protein